MPIAMIVKFSGADSRKTSIKVHKVCIFVLSQRHLERAIQIMDQLKLALALLIIGDSEGWIHRRFKPVPQNSRTSLPSNPIQNRFETLFYSRLFFGNFVRSERREIAGELPRNSFELEKNQNDIRLFVKKMSGLGR